MKSANFLLILVSAAEDVSEDTKWVTFGAALPGFPVRAGHRVEQATLRRR